MRLLIIVLGVISSPAWSHGTHATETGFISGLLHPMTGFDHALAAAGMGLWLGLQNFTRRSIPLYCLALAAGVALAGLWISIGGGFAGMEWILASTLIVTGFLLCKPLRLPRLPVVAAITTIFSCHFYAHIVEIPSVLNARDAFFHISGFFIATISMIAAAMYAAGSGRGSITWTRFAGAAIALAGATALGLA